MPIVSRHRTQKAKGLEWVTQAVSPPLYVPVTYKVVSVRYLQYLLRKQELPKTQEFLGELGKWWVVGGSEALFTRPAPLQPRHGFVDSRLVRTVDQLVALVNEVYQADPRGELIFGAYVAASWSGVLAPGLLTLGGGNDGATSGRGVQQIPLMPGAMWQSGNYVYVAPHPSIFPEAGIAEPQVRYVEFVQGRGCATRYGPTTGIFVVQLRAGPPTVPGDYVPRAVKVGRVLELGNGGQPLPSLLEWEKMMLQLRVEEGVVVYQPAGSAASHYGVHAILNEVPYFVTHRPEVGVEYAAITQPPPNIPAFIEGLVKPELLLREWDEVSPEELLNTHIIPDFPLRNLIPFANAHAPALMTSSEGAKLLGIAVAAGLKLALVALAGEARHAMKKAWLDRSRREMFHTPRQRRLFRGLVKELGLGSEIAESSRHGFSESRWRSVIWSEMWDRPLTWWTNQWLRRIHWLYTSVWWGGNSPGYGGMKWGECAVATSTLRDRVIEFARQPRELELRRVLAAFNILIDVSHNGGKLLTKFISAFDFNAAAGNEFNWLLWVIAPALWRTRKEMIADPQHRVIGGLAQLAAMRRVGVLVKRELAYQPRWLKQGAVKDDIEEEAEDPDPDPDEDPGDYEESSPETTTPVTHMTPKKPHPTLYAVNQWLPILSHTGEGGVTTPEPPPPSIEPEKGD